MSEYNKMAKGNFIAKGTSAVVQLPFKPDYVEIKNYSNFKLAGAGLVTEAFWDATLIDFVTNSNPTMIQLYNGAATALIDDVISNTSANPGINVFSAGQLLQFGPLVKHLGTPVSDFSIAKSASPTIVTTVGNHGLISGDVIIFEGLFQTATTGMPQLNYIWFTVTVTGATTFTIPWDTSGSNYTAFNTATSLGNIGAYRKVLYPYIYFPGTTTISAITLGATTLVDTTDAHNLVVGQEVAFRIPSQWGTTELNSLPNTLVPGSPVYGYVIEVIDYNSVRVNINSSAMTPFIVNIDPTTVPGLSYPQIVAVGDVNTGGVQISLNSPLYPPPYYVPIGNGNLQTDGIFTNRVNTINGPAILGAFVNNTSQGFTIGSGVGTTATTSTIMIEGNIIQWRAFFHDISIP